MSAADKAPRSALEEAVALYDALHDLVGAHQERIPGPETFDRSELGRLADLDRRRAALEPRLAKCRENQAKGRGEKEPTR